MEVLLQSTYCYILPLHAGLSTPEFRGNYLPRHCFSLSSAKHITFIISQIKLRSPGANLWFLTPSNSHELTALYVLCVLQNKLLDCKWTQYLQIKYTPYLGFFNSCDNSSIFSWKDKSMIFLSMINHLPWFNYKSQIGQLKYEQGIKCIWKVNLFILKVFLTPKSPYTLSSTGATFKYKNFQDNINIDFVFSNMCKLNTKTKMGFYLKSIHMVGVF